MLKIGLDNQLNKNCQLLTKIKKIF